MTEPRDAGDPEVGSLAEEAAKLLGALSGWAREHGADAGEVLHGLDEHLATGAPECTYCPICRTVHVVRQLSPEVKAHLGVAAASLAQAAAGLLASVVPDEPRARGARGDGVERIDLEEGQWPEEES